MSNSHDAYRMSGPCDLVPRTLESIRFYTDSRS